MKVPVENDKTIDSVDTPTTPTFTALRRLKSLGSRYEKFNGNSSLNNLEGPLTPCKTSPTLKQRLIKALGGYNLLDPRSPNQQIARTPVIIRNQNVLETTFDTSFNIEDDPYHIFEKEADQPEQSPEKEIPIEDVFEACTINPKDPRSPSEGIPRTPLALPEATIEDAVDAVINPKPEVKSSQTLIKSVYKDLIRRDPIYRDLLHEDEDETGKTTPVKKISERTPLGCLANKNLFNSTPLRASQLANKNEFADNFCDKIDRIKAGMNDENTPVGKDIIVSKAVAMSRSKIPIRGRRLE